MHRAQGATVDTAHVQQDGGGRELAYVKTSRAREHTIVYVTADYLDQAIEDLQRDWTHETRQRWVTDTHQPGTIPAPVVSALAGPCCRKRRGASSSRSRTMGRPRSPHPTFADNCSTPNATSNDFSSHARSSRRPLPRSNPELRALAATRADAQRELEQVRHALETVSWRRDQSNALERLDNAAWNYDLADGHWLAAIKPIERELQNELDTASLARDDLSARHKQRIEWLREHPEAIGTFRSGR